VDQQQQQRTRTVQLNIRAAFVAPPGYVILAVDYSQASGLLLQA
jgi:DNA polymerase I-like protein with 3'-5' exonuclease and polymerase domains